MTIGEKIKRIRADKKITQSELVGNKITRNMLSAIESDKASPSLDTLRYLASRLGVPIDYLVSDEYDLDFYLKSKLISEIKQSYSNKKYNECIELISGIQNPDDEISYILASCNFELGISAVRYGSMRSAAEYFERSVAASKLTMYDTSRYQTLIPMYQSIIKNINAPLLEFDIDKYENDLRNSMHYEFYKYLISDHSFSYSNKLYKMHLEAKTRIKERRYADAILLLHEIENNKTSEQYNIYLMIGVYADLDNCYKQLCDFENAYRYSSKRITLIENLNT